MTNAKILVRWFDEVWGLSRSVNLVDELMAEDGQVFGVIPNAPMNRAAFKEIWASYTTAFPDMTIDVIDTNPIGDLVAYRAVAKGTHDSKPFSFEGNGIVKFENGRIVESHETWNFLALMVQLGAINENALGELIETCAKSNRA